MHIKTFNPAVVKRYNRTENRPSQVKTGFQFETVFRF